MKKISYLLVMIFVFAMAITVDAKYRKYEIGDVIEFNGHYFIVIENSTVDDATLKVIDGYELYVSNYQELKDTCGDGSTISDIKCAAENAHICKSASNDCRIVRMPFETLSEEGHLLEYSAERETNIAYFIENAALPYYKEVTGLKNLKVRLMKAKEHIEIIESYDMSKGGKLETKYGDWNSRCGTPLRGVEPGSNGHPVAGEENYNWVYPSTAYWLDSLRYTARCNQVAEAGAGQDATNLKSITSVSAVRPVLEIDKREFAYPITTEVEGTGTLEIDVPDTDYKLGDVVYINEREWMVLGIENGEVRLIRTKPISISNEDEVQTKCGILLTSSSDVTSNIGEGMKAKLDCAFATMKYCKKENTGCHYIYLPYNYNSTEITYDESDENNVGSYVTNELNAYLEEDFGLTNLRPTVMTYQEVQDLKDRYARTNMFGSLPAPMGDEDNQILVPGALYPVLFRTGFIKDYTNYTGSYSTNYYNYVKPVVTLPVDKLPTIVKGGTSLNATTVPGEGYELSELKITTEDNETITYNPHELTRRGSSQYAFTMPGNATKVFAKFVEQTKYNVTSKTDELVVDEGLNRDEGDNVTFRVTEPEGKRLDKIIYYDEDNNVIEVEVEKDDSGDYIVTVPNKNVVVEAIFIPVFNLTGVDVTIPVSEGIEGDKLTFTVTEKENYVVTGLRFTDGKGEKITPYYTVIDGVYSIIMPASNVHVEADYHADQEERPIDEEIDNVPKTGDDITKYILVLGLGTFILIGTTCLLKTRIKKQEI